MKSLYIFAVLLLCLSLTVIAQDTTENKQSDSMENMNMENMPPMGPPTEMKEIEFLVGDWDVKGRFRMDPNSEWQEHAGLCQYKFVLDGAIMFAEFKGKMMGQDFVGHMYQAYDRETSQWQATWTDNMSARISMYTGYMKNDKLVLLGEDKFGGHTFLTKISSWDHTDQSFQWSMEHSMDGGESWYVGMEATYTKK